MAATPRPSRTFYNIGRRYLVRHPWQSILMILGIMLGVAVVVSIDLANESASRAFDLSTEAIVGKTTHHIEGGPTGIPDDVYVALRRSGVITNNQIPTAPIMTEFVVAPELGDRSLQMLGVDPFAEPPFRNYFGDSSSGFSNAAFVPFLTQPGAVLLAKETADRYDLVPGDTFIVSVSGRETEVTLVGVLDPADNLSRRAITDLLLVDVSTAKELTGRTNALDRIDLIITDPQQLTAIEQTIGADLALTPVAARTETINQMTAAFRVNLTALSLLALVVGMFLIYNTMTFAVVQRRTLFGTLRCLGVTRREVFAMVLIEALIVGIIGSVLGILLGIVMGQGAVRLVTQTINDLFFAVSVRGVQIPIPSLVKGGLLGVGATIMAAALPAWEAASVSPRSALVRSGLESKMQAAIVWITLGGVALLAVGAGLLFIETRQIAVSFAGTFAVIVGAALLAPIVTVLFMKLMGPVSYRLGGALGRMAPRDIVNSLSRTSIAVASLMVAVSVTIGVSLMVSSFRFTVVRWLDQTLQGDVYISAPDGRANQATSAIEPEIVSMLNAHPDVERVELLRSVFVDSTIGQIDLVAVNTPTVEDDRLLLKSDGDVDEVWQAMLAGGVLVSEPFVNRTGIDKGDEIVLRTAQGEKSFPVVATYYDYATPSGRVSIPLSVYQELWQDEVITAVALRLAPGVDPDQLSEDLKDQLSATQKLQIRSNRSLRVEALEVFDRTFAITGAMQVLATIVAFIGVLSALLSLQLEKQRELGILRAVGLTVRQLWSYVLLETGLLGLTAGLLALPTGFILSLILIFIINRRSFGWTLQLMVEPGPFVQAMAVAVIAALLAGIYPARKISKMITAEAIRFE